VAAHALCRRSTDRSDAPQITTGEEGWRTDGNNGSWIDNGSKGMDYAGNLALVDFATVHLCKLTSL